VEALIELERITCESGGTVLRLGHLYGPGTPFEPGGAFVEQLVSGRARQVGKGTAMFSFVHTHDVATAITAALDKDVAGPLNVVDDTPSCVNVWLPELARMVGAPVPKRVSVARARIAKGSWGVASMNRIVGADNCRARLTLDWRPRFRSWREGFAAELGPRSSLRSAG
jgi:nucleoside-diphosphate-sugar epimerase